MSARNIEREPEWSPKVNFEEGVKKYIVCKKKKVVVIQIIHLSVIVTNKTIFSLLKRVLLIAI